MNQVTKYRIIYRNTGMEAPEGEFLVGRSQECHLILNDPSISRVHLAIVNENGKLWAEDRGSRNGVRVNGAKIKERVALESGDKIEAGRELIEIVAFSAASPPKTHDKVTMTNLSPVTIGTRGDPTTTMENRQILMMAELSQKAIRVGKLEEGGRLLSNAVNTASKRLNDGAKLTDGEFNCVAETIIMLAEASKSSEMISKLFNFHLASAKLMSRELVEALYEAVRLTKYRACKEMSQYLAFLDSASEKFDPAERFVHRRLKGLVKICS